MVKAMTGCALRPSTALHFLFFGGSVNNASRGAAARAQCRPRLYLRARPPWPVVLGLFGPYQRYHGFCTHEPPLPGVAVILHCSKEVKPQFLPPRPEYTTHQGR